MRASLLLLIGLAACGPRPGTVTARWVGSQGPVEFEAPGVGSWCPETRIVLIDATKGDDAVGVLWRYEGEAPATGTLALGLPPDSTPTQTPATAALRYLHLDEVRGYRSITGSVALTAADTVAVTGTLTARMQRVGEVDSTELEMTFHAIPLVRDVTACVAPPAPAADSAAATP